MQATLAIARLTFKAALRFRLVPVLAVLLLGAVVALPEVIEHDGTARGLAQIVLTYTLGLTTALLGLTTLWLACGTLARDIEECQMQVVVVKPVARWQVWVGKWLGIMALNAVLLGLAAGIVYVELLWRARRLPQAQQEVLRTEVLVARGSCKPPIPDLEPFVAQVMQERLKNERVAAMDRSEVRKIVREQVKSQEQVVPPGYQRTWLLDLGSAASLRDQPMFLRIKFFAADRSPSGNYLGIWQIGPPNTAKRWLEAKSQAAETFHEFAIPPNMFDGQGVLTVIFQNQNETALLFPLEDGIEVLYRQGGFGLNYLRGVGILFCWLSLLAALGLAAASFLSFPVAAFFSLGVLIVAFSTGTMNQVIEQGTIRQVNPNTGEVDQAIWFDYATVAVFKGMRFAVNSVQDFSPVDLLSTGRAITWGQLARAVAQIIVVMGGFFALIGVAAFTRRELATAQGVT